MTDEPMPRAVVNMNIRSNFKLLLPLFGGEYKTGTPAHQVLTLARNAR